MAKVEGGGCDGGGGVVSGLSITGDPDRGAGEICGPLQVSSILISSASLISMVLILFMLQLGDSDKYRWNISEIMDTP